MDPYIVLIAVLGIVVLAVAWLPILLRDLPLSLPIFCVVFGFAVFAFPGSEPDPNPLTHPEITERLTEFVVIVALMGAGLKLDRRIGWRNWRTTWRLLGITMPLSILGIAGLGWWLLGLSPAAAVLLGALLAPTDPVLASDVQVGPPQSGEEDEIRFSLTSEAGLNDGLAFPFVNLAVAMALVGPLAEVDGWEWLGRWFAIDVAWKIAAGVGIGFAVGWTLGWLVFRLPKRARLSETRDGFVALGLTLVSYGVTELAHGYGFLAVFVTALAVRHHERSHAFHARLHDFAEQIERLLMMVLLVLFGGALAGGLLDGLTWPIAAVGLLFLFAVRPLAGLVGLAGTPLRLGERLVIGFFGIRGLGSFYYLAHALGEAEFLSAELLWALTGFVVLVSILVHGTTVTPIMNRLDRRWTRTARGD